MSFKPPVVDNEAALYPDAKFGLIAPFYQALERCIFGWHLDGARQAFPDDAVLANRILLVGEGSGRYLQWLLARKKDGCVCVVEKSPVMIWLAKTRIAGRAKVDLEFVQTDFRSYTAAQPFDCIVTHFFLDLFEPRSHQIMVEKFADLTTGNGTWINVDFVPPRTLAGRLLMWLQYTFFSIVSRIEARQCYDETAAANQNGWIVSEKLSFLNGFVVAKRYTKEKR
jgi:tRNA (cmo5U34)-methyltransferase